MTQEEKAKAYDEALERARKALSEISPENYGARKIIEDAFPALRESEDERMLRVIGLALTDVPEERFTSLGTTLKDCLAYLEKQKEQKMINLEIPAGDVAPSEEDGPFDEDEFLEDELSAFLQNYDEYIDDAAISDVAKHFYEIGKKQKEQKSAEWSEEDEETRKGVISDLCVLQDWTINYDTNWLANPVLKNIDKRISWLKSLPERFNLQPKQEWSEEDENSLEYIHELISFGYEQKFMDAQTAADMRAWVNKSLKNRGNFPKSNTNSPSWSEEDDDKLKQCIRIVSGWEGDYDIVKSPYSNFLKSLRPPQDRCEDCPHRGDMFLLTQGIKSGKHDLAITFMNYLDENRPEGKMSLSNAECEDIDNAFKENDWAKIVRYVDKYRPSWKPSEEQMKALLNIEGDLRAFQYNDKAKIIAELYEQLKRL